MDNFLFKIKNLWNDSQLRNRIIVVILMLVVFRALSSIPVPGVVVTSLSALLSNNQFFGALNVFSGGGLSTLSILMLGVGPYITASIIMQLLTMMIPSLKSMHQEEGEIGRIKFTQYSRMITIPLAVLQGFSLLLLLSKQGVIPAFGMFEYVVSISVITAGSMLLMWIGELLSEFGVGNGISLLIFAGIVASVPTHISQLLYTFNASQIPTLIAFLIAGILVIAGVVYITEAERLIPITYTKQVKGSRIVGGNSTYLPLKLNQAGVIPIIFALSILLFPQLIATFLSGMDSSTAQNVARSLTLFLQSTWLYSLVYFILVTLFTYFYTAVTFDPEQMATNLQKNGAFIPGIRPGQSTTEYLAKLVTKLTFVGAIFLGLVAVLPLIVRTLTGINSVALGGTALLIVVSVVLDLIKRTDAQLSLQEY